MKNNYGILQSVKGDKYPITKSLGASDKRGKIRVYEIRRGSHLCTHEENNVCLEILT